ncbi:MAG: amidase family protein, partial [Comamonadaceae bacterium]
MGDLHNLSVKALAALLQSKEVSAVEVATRFLARMGGNPHHAFLDIDSEATLTQARASDAKLANGTAGPLEGVPIAHKDVFVTRDFATTAGSKILSGYRSPFDATVVDRLRNAGMVTLGKLNCDEFAMGSSNENSAYGAVSNPWDTTRIPGGSSGGSAAAVAARLAPAATGTDTGGSIRQPASFCGITGIKPTYGRASRYGMIAYASSLDQAGPMARSAEDCALLLSAMCGPDLDRDSTSLDVPVENFSRFLARPLATAGKDGGPLKIGVPIEWLGAGIQATWTPNMPTCRTNGTDVEVQKKIEEALSILQSLGAKVLQISLDKTELAIPVYYIIAPAEASSNLSRFDGVKFGHRTKNYTDLVSMYKKSRAEGFGEEVKRRIMTGAYVL